MEALNFNVRRIGDPNIERIVQVFRPLCMNGNQARQQANCIVIIILYRFLIVRIFDHMKWLMILFSLYVLALSAVPCCGDDLCCEDEIMLQQGNEGDKDHDHNRPEPPCSPFFSCSTCHGAVISQVTPAITPQFVISKKLRFQYTEHFLSEYATAIWQPPQVA